MVSKKKTSNLSVLEKNNTFTEESEGKQSTDVVQYHLL
jgi:hypothetical protein